MQEARQNVYGLRIGTWVLAWETNSPDGVVQEGVENGVDVWEADGAFGRQAPRSVSGHTRERFMYMLDDIRWLLHIKVRKSNGNLSAIFRFSPPSLHVAQASFTTAPCACSAHTHAHTHTHKTANNEKDGIYQSPSAALRFSTSSMFLLAQQETPMQK